MTNTDKNRPRIVPRPNGPLFRYTPAEMAYRTGYSESQWRRILNRGGQIGEPFIAAALLSTPHGFYELFEVRSNNNQGAPQQHPGDVFDNAPTSWDEALLAGMIPEPGPTRAEELGGGRESDRIVLRHGETPVLAFLPDGGIAIYKDTTAGSPLARAVLAARGYFRELPDYATLIPVRDLTANPQRTVMP